MIRILFILILIIGFAIGFAVFAPLGFVLKTFGAETRGLSWDTTEGTLTSGRITGLHMDNNLIGDAELNIVPSSLLALKLEYKFDWTGPAGRGNGNATISGGNSVELSNYNIDLEFSQLKDAPPWVRQSGGTARLSGDIIQFRDGACSQASGRSWSDALTRHEALLGPGWQELSGTISCDGGSLRIPFASENTTGTRLDAIARLGMITPSRFEARVSGFIPQQFSYGLPYAGFVRDGNAFVYNYPVTRQEPPR